MRKLRIALGYLPYQACAHAPWFVQFVWVGLLIRLVKRNPKRWWYLAYNMIDHCENDLSDWGFNQLKAL